MGSAHGGITSEMLLDHGAAVDPIPQHAVEEASLQKVSLQFVEGPRLRLGRDSANQQVTVLGIKVQNGKFS